MLTKTQLPYFASLRLLCIVLVVFFRFFLHPFAYVCFFWAILFGHYFLAIVYARQQVLYILKTPRTYLPAIFLMGISFFFFGTHFEPIIIAYFGLHHALTETYLTTPGNSNLSPSAQSEGILSRFILCFLIYVLLQRQQLTLPETATLPILVLMSFAFLFFVFMHYKRSAHYSKPWFKDIALFETCGVIAALLIFQDDILFRDIIFYHLLIWMFHPLSTPKLQQNKTNRRRYIWATALATLAFFVATPITSILPELTSEIWREQAILWGYIHISTSLMFSRMNPFWVKRWFMPPQNHSQPLRMTPGLS